MYQLKATRLSFNRPTQMLFTCPPTIRGSYTEIRSSPTPGGFLCPESFMAAHQFTLAVVLESASSADLGGAGITGIMIGTVAPGFITTIPTSLTAARSSIATTSITTAAILTMATRSTGADLEAEIQDSMGLHLLTLSRVHVPARSVALITAEMYEAFPPAGSLALEAAPMEVDFTAVGPTAVGPTVVGGIGDRTYPCMEFVENSRME